jgi:hypothetical protein
MQYTVCLFSHYDAFFDPVGALKPSLRQRYTNSWLNRTGTFGFLTVHVVVSR